VDKENLLSSGIFQKCLEVRYGRVFTTTAPLREGRWRQTTGISHIYYYHIQLNVAMDAEKCMMEFSEVKKSCMSNPYTYVAKKKKKKLEMDGLDSPRG
jgi:hypothetical protein